MSIVPANLLNIGIIKIVYRNKKHKMVNFSTLTLHWAKSDQQE